MTDANVSSAPTSQENEGSKDSTILGSAVEKPTENSGQGQVAAENKTTPEAPVEIEIKLPEGFEANAEMLDSYKNVAKETGLNGENATKIANWFIQHAQVVERAQAEEWAKQSTNWEASLKVDPDFGGANYSKNVDKARSAVVRFGGQELAAELNKYGIGNLPPLVKAFSKIGEMLAEDSASVKASGAPVELTEAERNKLRYNNSR